MTTTAVISELGNKYLPFPLEQFFTPQRAPDMWFGDEMPPTLQAEMNNPAVAQAKWMVQMQMRQTLAQAAHQQAQRETQRRMAVARSRIGKRAKSSRH